MARPVGRSFWIFTSDLVERTVASLPSRVSAGPSGVCLTSTLVSEVMGSAGGVSSSGGYPNHEGVMLCAPWASVELDSMSPTSTVVGGVMRYPCGITVSWLTASGVVLPKFQKISDLLKVTCLLTCCFNSTMLITTGQ